MSEGSDNEINKIQHDPSREPTKTISGRGVWGYADRRSVAQKITEMTQKSKIDSLTGVLEKSVVTDKVEQLLQSKNPFSLMFVDADYFKKVNDTYGHNVGDQVLSILAQRMKKEISNEDIIGRIGGEEFLIVLQGISDPIVAENRADDIRTAVNKTPIHCSGGISVTQSVSIGVALSRSNESSRELINRADQAVYLAKKLGRNRVVTEADLRDTNL